MNYITVIKDFLEIIVYIFAIISFWYGRHLLKYKLDEGTRKLYLENYFKVQIVLDKFIKTGKITQEDINDIALANQEAEMYLNNEIVGLTKQILNTMAHFYSYIEENNITNTHNHKDELAMYKENLSTYKVNLAKYYRKYLVY